MKTKTIFNFLAFAMLMAAMVLTTACSGSEDLAVNKPETTEPIAKKGYPLQVTVNVTREGDDATRATYNETDKILEFSEGDQLFVRGYDDKDGGAGKFAGTLTWQSGGTFSGTIYTQNSYTGTAEELLSSATNANALLLPDGYTAYNYITLHEDSYNSYVGYTSSNTYATTKKLAVEQFSDERATSYSNGFALHPQNCILSFTIYNLTANATDVAISFTGINDVNISKTVTADADGKATFAIGVEKNTNLNQYALTVGGTAITLGSHALVAGKIYNITRGTGATVDLSTINAAYTAQNGETLTGTLTSNVKISIAHGATVILNGVSINAEGTWTSGDYAGITCLGDATIILSGTNTVKGFNEDYPGIYVYGDSENPSTNKTLTIKGSGSLTASSNDFGAGIGGGFNIDCGNIDIQGGTVTATGGTGCAGIGSGNGANCGNITISGGTVTATGDSHAAGIGSGDGATCGTITISGGTVTATGGNWAAGIGSGNQGTCNDITISGGTVTATGASSAAGIGSGHSGYLKKSSCGAITISGGTVTATGGGFVAGIGSGANGSSCGDITITSGVTHVTATKGEDAPNSIGASADGTCGTVTIGGVVTGNITESPYTYQP